MRNDVPTMVADPLGADPGRGRVVWSPLKSLWWSAMAVGGLVAATCYFSWGGFLLFLATTAVTLCLGHSLGMHRRFIHRSYEAPLWLERLFVYLGTLVGMAGPLGMMRTHDLRDWAQRQAACHDYFGHRRAFLHDGWWQLHCDIELERPPRFVPPAEVDGDRFYQWLERWWMWQQLPWAVAFLALGGTGWVLWGVCARVAVGVTGHWLVGHFAHREGHQQWDVTTAAVQGYNVRLPGLGPVGAWVCGLVTMGEGWHNNHHAFPASARLGLERWQLDPGWWVLLGLRRAGLVRGLALPADLPHRPELRELAKEAAAGLPTTYPLTLLYDRNCLICQTEMDALRDRDAGRGRLRFIDISTPGFDPAPYGRTLEQLNASIHGVAADGRLVSGMQTLRLAYAAAGLGWVLRPTGWPLLQPLFDRFYAGFAQRRYGISAALAPVLERAAAWRTARRLQRCQGGRCDL